MSRFIKSNNELYGDVTINNGKLTTTGGSDTSLVDNAGADVDIESPNNLKFKVGNDKYFQFFDDGDIVMEIQGGTSGHNIKLYDADSPSNGSIDFASLSVGANGELTINTTSLSDADINIGCVTGQVHITSDLLLANNKKLHLDGAGNTYIQHPTSPGDEVKFVVGSDTLLVLTEAGNSGNIINMGTSGAGFTQFEPTYNGTDTYVYFSRFGNKAFLTFGAGNIADLNLSFPDVSCNCTLVLKQDGTGGRTVAADGWLTTDQDGSNASTVKWAGGSPPTLSTGGNAIDIISFYWDNDNHTAYGVASLNFS